MKPITKRFYFKKLWKYAQRKVNKRRGAVYPVYRCWRRFLKGLSNDKTRWAVLPKQPPHGAGETDTDNDIDADTVINFVVERTDPNSRSPIVLVVQVAAQPDADNSILLRACQHYCDKYKMDRVWTMKGTGTQARIWMYDVRGGFLVPHFQSEEGEVVAFTHDIDPTGPDGHLLIHCLHYIRYHPVPDIRLLTHSDIELIESLGPVSGRRIDKMAHGPENCPETEQVAPDPTHANSSSDGSDGTVLPLEPDIDTPQDEPPLTVTRLASFVDNNDIILPLAGGLAGDNPPIVIEAEVQDDSPSPINPGTATADLPSSSSCTPPNLDTPSSSAASFTTTSTTTSDGTSILTKIPSNGTAITYITINNFNSTTTGDNVGKQDMRRHSSITQDSISVEGHAAESSDGSPTPLASMSVEAVDEIESPSGSSTPLAPSKCGPSEASFARRRSVVHPAPASVDPGRSSTSHTDVDDWEVNNGRENKIGKRKKAPRFYLEVTPTCSQNGMRLYIHDRDGKTVRTATKDWKWNVNKDPREVGRSGCFWFYDDRKKSGVIYSMFSAPKKCRRHLVNGGRRIKLLSPILRRLP